MAAKTLDLSGLQCPMPILKTKKALTGMLKGDIVEVLATDPGAVEDFKVFCTQSGNTLLESDEVAGVYRFLIRREA